MPRTAKGASTSSEELNAQISPRTDEEHNLPYHEDYWQEYWSTGFVCQSWRLSKCTVWDCPHQHAPFKERRATIQAYDDWKSTTERTLSALWADMTFIMSHISSGLTNRFTFLLTTFVATALSCFEVTPCELLCLLAPCGLGDPGWGIPGFRMVLLLLRSPPGVAL